MTKRVLQFTTLLASMLLLCGCCIVEKKTASLSVVYGCMAVLSFLLLIGCS